MNMLEQSIYNHQKLVDLIAENADQDGICYLSTPKMAELLGISQSLIMRFIKQINVEEICIYRVNSGYSLNFRDISKQGTFAKIIRLCAIFESDTYLWNCNEKALARSYKVQRRTIQATKTYLKNM